MGFDTLCSVYPQILLSVYIVQGGGPALPCSRSAERRKGKGRLSVYQGVLELHRLIAMPLKAVGAVHDGVERSVVLGASVG